MIGAELALLPGIGRLERIYIKILGVPISGLRIRLRRILPLLSGEPKTILDAGCGRGVFSIELAKRFPNAQVIAVDIDESQLNENRKLAVRLGLNNLQYIQGDVGKLPFKRIFDLVISVDNLEHIENDQAAINGLATALKDGGKIILHVPGKERRWLFLNIKPILMFQGISGLGTPLKKYKK